VRRASIKGCPRDRLLSFERCGRLPHRCRTRDPPRANRSALQPPPGRGTALGHAHIARDGVPSRGRLRNGDSGATSGKAARCPAEARREVPVALAPDAVAARRAHQSDARSQSRRHPPNRLRSRSPACGGRPPDDRSSAAGIARTSSRPVRADDDAGLAAMGVAAHGLPPSSVRCLT